MRYKTTWISSKKNGIVNNEKWRESRIANAEDFNEEEYATRFQKFLQKRLELKIKTEALLKSEGAGAVLPGLQDPEQRLADVLVNSAPNKTRNCGTLPQEEPELDDERKEQ